MLKTLDEHNKQRRQMYTKPHIQQGNGIACPKCNTELFDTNNTNTLLSIPPQKQVYCDKCDYTGYRIV